MTRRRRRLRRRPKRVLEPLDWSLTSAARGMRGDLQELILFPILRRFAKLRLKGEANLDSHHGPFVVVANHTSHFDAPLVLAALPHRIRQRTIVAAAADYFYKVQAVGALASLAIGTIPFQRHEGSSESLERCKEGLRRGWSVVIFPEGSRSKSGSLGDFKKGAAILCLDTRTAALPMHIRGAYEIMPRGSSLPRRGRVTINIGSPLGPRPDDTYETFTETLRAAVEDLGDG